MSNSSQWYTPGYIKEKVRLTFDAVSIEILDPFPPNGTGGYELDWTTKFVYCNPPIPASKAALKAIETYENDKSVNIIFAGYSESVCWQVPELETYVHAKCRQRINWIDGREYIKVGKDQWVNHDTARIIDGEFYNRNHNYLQPGRNPAHYSSFFLLSQDTAIIQRFIDNFSDMGVIKYATIHNQNYRLA